MTGSAHPPAGKRRRPLAVPATRYGQRRHGDYCRGRARQIAYGRWQPWADAAPVREHLRVLRAGGASYQTIARAAGVSPMTVHRLLGTGPPGNKAAAERVRAATAERMLAVTTVTVAHAAPRRDATGTRRRLRALIAIGHPAASLARRAGLSPLAVVGHRPRATLRRSRPPRTPRCAACTGSCGISRRLRALRLSAMRPRWPGDGRNVIDGPRRWASTTTGSMTLPTGRGPGGG